LYKIIKKTNNFMCLYWVKLTFYGKNRLNGYSYPAKNEKDIKRDLKNCSFSQIPFFFSIFSYFIPKKNLHILNIYIIMLSLMNSYDTTTNRNAKNTQSSSSAINIHHNKNKAPTPYGSIPKRNKKLTSSSPDHRRYTNNNNVSILLCVL
jgi:hypothetical protein